MTLKEIAEQTGYSVATVSRVLNGGAYNENSRTYAAIMEFVQSNGYSRGSRGGRIVANLIPDIANPISTAIAKTMQQICRGAGLSLVIVNTNEDPKEEAHALQALAKLNLYGMIYSPVIEDESQDFASFKLEGEKERVPVVMIGRELPFAAYDSVCINNVAGAFDATAYLLQKGITDIAVIAGPRNTKPGRERLEGFYQACRCFNVQPKPGRIHYGDFTTESGYIQAREILRASPRPQAIFPMNNLMTRGCLRALMEARVSVSSSGNGDMEMVSFDGDDLLDIVAPDVPYVERPVEELGRVAMELLFNRAKRGGRDVLPVQYIKLTPILKIPGGK
ncbi:MAG: LacI family transcriptional regulator [Oscillospiraceae bacterium]|jgi:LacI family transcriptional regulator|nr:LacI family transcriptional regulator [Oscillospiraceae bacterium]MCI8942318.1 LacI family transcriptional regulator [Oscillospiraceae bacterium]